MTRRILIGDFELEPAARRLRRRGGAVVPLARRPFQVLLHLVANRERLVTRAELLELFWGGRDVYEDAMTRCISSVRKALGERAGTARYIETRWAEGYRFVAPCRELDGAPGGGWPWPAEELIQRGLAYLAQSGSSRSFRYALEMFRQASALAPEDPRAHGGLAACHALLHIFAEASDEHRAAAAAALERALDIDRECAQARLGRALVALTHGDTAGADESFRLARDLEPTLFHAWYYHGRICAARDDHDRALTCFLRAAEVKPDDCLALALSAESFRRLGLRADERRAARGCVDAAERALRARPDDVRAMSLAASVLPALRHDAEAIGLTERAVALEPYEIIVNVNAAGVFARIGDFGRAARHLRRVQAVGRGAYVQHWLAHDPELEPVRSHALR